jgi:hypothetical protein
LISLPFCVQSTGAERLTLFSTYRERGERSKIAKGSLEGEAVAPPAACFVKGNTYRRTVLNVFSTTVVLRTVVPTYVDFFQSITGERKRERGKRIIT